VRFDDAASLAVDFTRSVGVIGQHRKDATLYIALDEAVEDVIVALRNAPAGGSAPYLLEGRWTFRDLRRRACGFSVMAKGFGTGQMTWGGLKPGLYRASVRNSKESLWDEEAEVGEDGRLALTADADAISPVDIDVTCIEGDN
jgi:hypothetical protein